MCGHIVSVPFIKNRGFTPMPASATVPRPRRGPAGPHPICLLWQGEVAGPITLNTCAHLLCPRVDPPCRAGGRLGVCPLARAEPAWRATMCTSPVPLPVARQRCRTFCARNQPMTLYQNSAGRRHVFPSGTLVGSPSCFESATASRGFLRFSENVGTVPLLPLIPIPCVVIRRHLQP